MRKLLLGVGAMKAGTTWLYRQLEQHPNILFAPEKELHFLAYRDGDSQSLNLNHRWSRTRRAWERARENGSLPPASELAWYADYLLLPKTWAWYRRRLGKPADGLDYSADFSNLSATLGSEGWGEVARRYAHIRALYMLRHPLDRIWSHIKFHHQMAGAQLDDSSSPDLGHLADMARAHSAYGSNLTTMISALGRERILPLNFDSITTDPLATLRDIEQFLDLPEGNYLEAKLHRKINATTPSAIPGWVRGEFGDFCNRELDVLGTLDVDVPSHWYSR